MSVHDEIEALGGLWYVRALAHVIVDRDGLSELRCQMPECILDSRERFEVHAGGRDYQPPHQLTIDHIERRVDGGSNAPENLRIAHRSCNTSASNRGRKDPPWVLAKKKASRQHFLATGDKAEWLSALRSRPEGWNRKTRADDRRYSTKKRSLTDAQVLAARAEHARGEPLHPLAARYGVSWGTMQAAVAGSAAYQNI